MTHDSPPAATQLRLAVSSAIRECQVSLVADLSVQLPTELRVQLNRAEWPGCLDRVVDLIATAVESSYVDPEAGALADLQSYSSRGLDIPALFRSVYACECSLLERLALDERLGASGDRWPAVAHLVRSASIDLLAGLTELLAAVAGDGAVRDALTTLIVRPVFDLALAQEVDRAHRHQHPLSLVLFELTNLGAIRTGYGDTVADRVMERMAICVRRFFRHQDWVARHDDRSIAVLLPQTTLDDAMALAESGRQMVEQRLALVDHRTDLRIPVQVSAAAAGTDLLDRPIDATYFLAAAEDAVRRIKTSGRNRVERVDVLRSSLTLLGAATILDCPPSVIRRLVREGRIRTWRRGRHYQVDRGSLEKCRRAICP